MVVETIGLATLYCADWRDVDLPVVDHVITDPPYEHEAHTLQRRTTEILPGGHRRPAAPKPLDFASITQEERLQAAASWAALSCGWVLAFCQAEAVAAWRDALIEGGAKWKRSCVWIKPNGQPQLSGDRPGMGYESIACAWAGEGKSVWNGGGRVGVFTHNTIGSFQVANGEARVHMAQKPIALMNELVDLFTAPGQTVLDAYMGSGTTGVACVNQGRRFIGVELEPRHFETACERIDMAQRQGQLWGAEG